MGRLASYSIGDKNYRHNEINTNVNTCLRQWSRNVRIGRFVKTLPSVLNDNVFAGQTRALTEFTYRGVRLVVHTAHLVVGHNRTVSLTGNAMRPIVLVDQAVGSIGTSDLIAGVCDRRKC